MLTQQIALVSEVPEIELGEMMKVGAALQKQASRDLSPIWNVSATVDAFAKLEDVPIGYWPVIVVEDVKGAAGYHEDEEGQPFALVELGDSWSLTASHEVLEMLVDPFGRRLIAGPSIKKNQGRVEYLVEICDPSEAEEFAYTVNEVLVSDFYTPRFFDPVGSSGVSYSFTGAIRKPRQVLRGGYVSWRHPITKHWWQQTYFGSKPEFRDLGILTGSGMSLRALVDAASPETMRLSRLPKKNAVLSASLTKAAKTEKSTNAKAVSWRAQIASLCGKQ